MRRYFATRLIEGLVTLAVVSIVVFLLARMTGDPLSMLLPIGATPEDFTRARQVLALDQPLFVQYSVFAGNALHGDFGTSVRTGQPVGDLILARLPSSLALAAVALLVALVIAIPLGVLAAQHRGTSVDALARGVALIGQVVPSFCVGIFLMLLFSVRLRMVPTSGAAGPLSYVLPGVTLGWMISAGILRLLRSSMLDVLDADYVRLARAEGLPERKVIWRHALRNALIPVTTFSGLMFGSIIAAAVVVETVFSWPGIGRLAFEAVSWRDFPLIQGVVLVWTALVIAISLAVDFAYALLDPRIRT